MTAFDRHPLGSMRAWSFILLVTLVAMALPPFAFEARAGHSVDPSVSGTVPASPANNNQPSITGSVGGSNPHTYNVDVYPSTGCTGAIVGSATGLARNATFSIQLSVDGAVADNSTTTFSVRATSTTTGTHANTACSNTTTTYVEDSTAPGTPIITGSTPASPSSTNSPTINGIAETGSTVKLYTNDCIGTPVATGTATAGNFSISVTVAADISTTYKATATDAAGNVSACSGGFTYVEDSSAPSAPTITGSAPASPSNDNNPTINGTAEAGSTVKLYTNDCTGTPAGTGTATGGNFSIPVAAVAANESTTFKATATDAAGNVSACSGGFTYVEDSSAPSAPTITGSAPASPSNDNNPTINGTAEAGSTVKLYTNDCTGTPAGTGTATAGNFSISVTVAANESTTFKATATDAAGNPSPCSSGFTYVEDSTIGTPSITGSTPASPSSVNNPTINGTAEAGSTVKLYTNDCTGVPVETGTAPLGVFSISVTVDSDDSTTFKATATDAAGNVSGCSSGFTYVEDSSAPTTPSITGSTPASPSNDDNPTINGTAETGSTVTLYSTTDCTGTAAGTGLATGGNFSITVTVDDSSSTTFKATATDAAGNVSGCSSSAATYVHDSTAPSAPSVTGSTPASPSNDDNPTIDGTAETGSTVTLYTTTDCTGTIAGTDTASLGLFAISVTVPADSSTTFKATATDAAGNESDCSTSSVTYVEDSTGPSPDNVAPDLAAADDTGDDDDDITSQITNLTFSGTYGSGGTSDGFTVKLFDGTTELGSTTVSSNVWTIDNITLEANDTHTLHTKVYDLSDNASLNSPTLTVTTDTSATAPTLTGSTPSSPSSDNRPTIDGTAEAGATVTLYSTSDCTGIPAGTATATGGTFSIRVSVADDSSTDFYADITDVAGNESDCSSSSVIYVEDSTVPGDTRPPETTIDDGPVEGSVLTTGDVTFEFSSDEVNSTFSCQLEKDGLVIQTPAACDSGSKTYNSLANGDYEFTVIAKDFANNVDATPATRNFTVNVPAVPPPDNGPPADTTPPDTSIISGPTAGATIAFDNPSISFSSTESGSTFECSLVLDGNPASFSSCSSPRTYTGLANGTYDFEVRATDVSDNTDPSPATLSFSVDVDAARETHNGGTPTTATTDSDGQPGASADDPVETTITVPTSAGPGPIAIDESDTITTSVSSWNIFGQQVQITSPAAASPTDPLVFRFAIDPSVLPNGSDGSDIRIFKNGGLVGFCSFAGIAAPDPCMLAPDTSGQDIIVTVYTTSASVWNFGIQRGSSGQPPLPQGPAVDRTPPTVDAMVSNDRLSPNGDGRMDDVTISGTLSEPTDWNLDVRGSSSSSDAMAADELFFSASGHRQTTMSVTWDGRAMGSEERSIVADGVYTWELTGTDANGNAMTPETGTITVDRTAPVFTKMRVRPTRVHRRPWAMATIRFRVFEELSGPTTVKVKIVRRGRVIRHLGALTSSEEAGWKLLWDLRNGNDRKVKPGRYRVVLKGVDLAHNSVKNRGLIVRVKKRR